MTAIFFKVSPKQELEIKELMDVEGYTSKAEFFRFLIKFFKYNRSAEDIRLEKATSDLASVLKKLNLEGKLNKTIDQQLEDV